MATSDPASLPAPRAAPGIDRNLTCLQGGYHASGPQQYPSSGSFVFGQNIQVWTSEDRMLALLGPSNSFAAGVSACLPM